MNTENTTYVLDEKTMKRLRTASIISGMPVDDIVQNALRSFLNCDAAILDYLKQTAEDSGVEGLRVSVVTDSPLPFFAFSDSGRAGFSAVSASGAIDDLKSRLSNGTSIPATEN
jgi:hypothetical protein